MLPRMTGNTVFLLHYQQNRIAITIKMDFSHLLCVATHITHITFVTPCSTRPQLRPSPADLNTSPYTHFIHRDRLIGTQILAIKHVLKCTRYLPIQHVLKCVHYLPTQHVLKCVRYLPTQRCQRFP